MAYKRVLTVQDISCIGQCSMTVALPIISACGVETVVLPTAVLSSHTGGFKDPFFKDLTDDIPKIEAHWVREGIKFDAVYTGYLGSSRQIAMVKDIMDKCAAPGCLRIVDPAMADHGKLYKGFDMAFAEDMKELCVASDIVLPNVTEACLLTGTPYREEFDEAFARELMEKLCAMGCRSVVFTGASFREGHTGVAVLDGGEFYHYEHPRCPKNCNGSGDIFASAFTGALMSGKTVNDAARIAADFAYVCVANSQDDPGHVYGAKFEPCIKELIRML